MSKAGKYEIAFAILCVICVSVFFVSAVLTAEIDKENSATYISSETQIPQLEEHSSTTYVLMEREGRVYVYSAGIPFMLTDIDPLGLPAADREQLKQGIGADDRDTLLGLIEDFGS